MKLNVIENKEGILKIEIEGEGHTLLNVLRENCWEAGATQANYILDHPYLTNPTLVVHAKNPEKVLASAAKLTVQAAKEFGAEFRKAVKK